MQWSAKCRASPAVPKKTDRRLRTVTVVFARAALAVAVALAVPGCAPRPDPGAQMAARPSGVVHTVQIAASYQFVPAEVRITVGDAVEWRNISPVNQTITAVRGAAPLLVRLPTSAQEFESGIVRPGDSFRYQFTVPGVYQYVSRLAVGTDMVGTVLVTERR